MSEIWNKIKGVFTAESPSSPTTENLSQSQEEPKQMTSVAVNAVTNDILKEIPQKSDNLTVLEEIVKKQDLTISQNEPQQAETAVLAIETQTMNITPIIENNANISLKTAYEIPKNKNRRYFTKMVVKLLQEMIDSGETPILDYVLRSTDEQKRLFANGLSKCDGIVKISKHQVAKAADIYLVDKDGDAEFEWNPEKAKKWHDRWEIFGGDKMIEWDLGHFQM